MNTGRDTLLDAIAATKCGLASLLRVSTMLIAAPGWQSIYREPMPATPGFQQQQTDLTDHLLLQHRLLNNLDTP